MLAPYEVKTGLELLGEVVSWSLRKFSIQFPVLVQRLGEAGLDPNLARALSPRNAFSRACGKLRDGRVIDRVVEEEDTICFQFTAKSQGKDRLFEFWTETLVFLNKRTGRVTADIDSLAQRAQEELDRAMGERTGTDVSNLVQKVFEAGGDLFAIQGGCWFVPEVSRPLSDKVETFLGGLGQQLRRFPVPKGTKEGDRSVREVVVRGLQQHVLALREAIAGFGDSTRPSSFEKAAERIQEQRFKLEAYAELLSSQREELDRALDESNDLLRQKVEELGK